MNSELEIEVKLTLLSPSPLSRFRAVLGEPAARREQLNRYFVPTDSARTVVRVREEGGGLVLTVKVGGEHDAAGIFRRPERNQAIPPEWLFSLLETGECAALSADPVMHGVGTPLTYLGQLRNTRRLFKFESWTIELDHTFYPDGEEIWELEIESEDAHKALERVSGWLDAQGLPWRPSTAGKFSLFLEKSRRVES